MTPESMHARAIEELAEQFSRPHPNPAQDATEFIGRLRRQGWRPVAALADRPSPPRTAPRPVAEAAMAQIRADLAAVKRRRTGGEA